MRDIICSRRELFRVGLGGLGLVLVSGCPVRSTFSTGEGTGVQGLDNPSQILSNPYVADVINEAREEGLRFGLSREVNPPVISGRYALSGRTLFPNSGPLNSGTFRWSNQTQDNHIDTNYDQLTQTGTSSEGEIIRGDGNSFTVYSIMRVRDGGCDERSVFIVDGRQDSAGNISASYIITPIADSLCFVPTAGELDLTLTGGAKTLNYSKDGFSLMALK